MQKIIGQFSKRLCLSLLFLGFVNSALADNIEILTGAWPPYINNQQEPTGSAARALELIATEAGVEFKWGYQSYALAYQLVKRKKSLATFPFFKTEQRLKEVLFSDPIFSVRSRIYYNRQFTTAQQASETFKDLRIGRVAGYSYGQQLDKLIVNPIIYSNEKAALEGLFNEEIDLLPMTEGVMQTTLSREFPNRVELIRPVNGIADESSLHLVAAMTPEGEDLINTFNKALKTLEKLGISVEPPRVYEQSNRIDLAKLIPAEGYPLILGRKKNAKGEDEYYTLPQGTRVIVTTWSEKVENPSKTDRLYKTMVEESEVVVLSGPHVGKELRVRNMHIELL